jgi:hypothetical protein
MEWSLAPHERGAVLGDLEEGFANRAEAFGDRAATAWYWRQTLRSIGPNLLRRLRRDKPFQQAWLQQFVAAGVLAVFCFGFPDGRVDSQAATGWFAAMCFVNSGRIPWLDGGPTLLARILMNFVALAVMSIACPPLAILMAFAVRPRKPSAPAPWPPDAWIVRGPASPGELPFSHLAAIVPNRPLGLSGLVLATSAPLVTDGASNTFEFLGAHVPTIRREFGRATTLRVFTAVYAQGRPISASLQIVDVDDRVVQTIAPVVTLGDMEEVREPWSREATLDTSADFARVDGRFSLADLAPGPYTIRLTVSDGKASKSTGDRISVYDSPGDGAPLLQQP